MRVVRAECSRAGEGWGGGRRAHLCAFGIFTPIVGGRGFSDPTHCKAAYVCRLDGHKPSTNVSLVRLVGGGCVGCPADWPHTDNVYPLLFTHGLASACWCDYVNLNVCLSAVCVKNITSKLL